MIRKLTGEIWKPVLFPGWKALRNRYAVSNKGRIASYRKDVNDDGKLLNGSLTTGYRTLNLHRESHKGTLYVHRELAKLFLKKPSNEHRFVIHVNHDKMDNRLTNLRWVTKEGMIDHQQKSPAKRAYKLKQATRLKGPKLSLVQVTAIKKLLTDKKRTITIRKLAEKYQVSEMTMYRIKSGENWDR
jgi:hypothetical protein